MHATPVGVDDKVEASQLSVKTSQRFHRWHVSLARVRIPLGVFRVLELVTI